MNKKKYGELCRVDNCGKPRDGRHSVCGMHRSRLSRYKSLEVPVFSYPEGIVHECRKCGYLTIEQSYRNPKTGHYSCIKCRRDNDKKFYKDHPELNGNDYKKNYYVKHKTDKVKLTKKEYSELLIKQNYVCAICKQPETAKTASGKIKRLSIDHKHGTNIVRDLLCNSCNLKRR